MIPLQLNDHDMIPAPIDMEKDSRLVIDVYNNLKPPKIIVMNLIKGQLHTFYTLFDTFQYSIINVFVQGIDNTAPKCFQMGILYAHHNVN